MNAGKDWTRSLLAVYASKSRKGQMSHRSVTNTHKHNLWRWGQYSADSAEYSSAEAECTNPSFFESLVSLSCTCHSYWKCIQEISEILRRYGQQVVYEAARPKNWKGAKKESGESSEFALLSTFLPWIEREKLLLLLPFQLFTSFWWGALGFKSFKKQHNFYLISSDVKCQTTDQNRQNNWCCQLSQHWNASSWHTSMLAQVDLQGLISLFMNPINVWSAKLKENTNLTVLTMFEEQNTSSSHLYKYQH